MYMHQREESLISTWPLYPEKTHAHLRTGDSERTRQLTTTRSQTENLWHESLVERPESNTERE